jgi:hypothetical protein
MTTTTSTYSSPIQSSFPLDALTTTFTPPASCSGIYSSGGVAVIDADLACLPQGFTSLSTNYFSPGIQCPAGYVTACNDNAGVSSITTVTCCPHRGDITLGCVTPSTLSNVWETLFCTWIAPQSPGTVVNITLSEGRTTSTSAVTMMSGGGINALGIRMVYQSSDILAISGTGATSGTAAATSTGPAGTGAAGETGGDSSSGLSTGAIIAIAVIIPVVLSAVAAGLFFIRKRKQALTAQQHGQGAAGMTYDYSKNGYSAVAPGAGAHYDPKSPAPPSEVSGVGAYGVRNQQQELAELGHEGPPAELPAGHYR